MVSVEKAVIARLMKGGKKFEILVDPELSMQVKAGKSVPADQLLATQEVYEDIGKGLRVGGDLINKTFGTSNIMVIAEKIIRDGDVQLTTEQRNKILEDKTRAVAAIISRQGMNPQTGAPHPQERILNAMEQAKARVDISKRPEEQVEAVLSKIQSIIPISFEKIKIAIKLPAQFSAKGSGIVRSFGKPSREEWRNDGSYLCLLEIAAAAQQDLYDRLNALTHGEVEVKIVK